MNVEKHMVCRLCLKTPLSEFTLIDQTAREMLDVLLVNTNLNLSDNPLMCKDCTETLKKSLTFKSVCMDSEEVMLLSFSSVECNSNANLKDVEAYNSRNVDLNSCRFCMKKFKGKNLIPLNVPMKERKFSYIVKKYLFQMDLNITKNPQICVHCRDNMESYFEFLQNCHDTEKKINEYQRRKGLSSAEKILLSSVFEPFVEDVKAEETCNSIPNEEYNREVTDLQLHKETTNCAPCETEVSTSNKRHDISYHITLDNNIKIETEELIIKDEVTLNESSTNRQQKTYRGVYRRKIHKCDKCKFQSDRKSHLDTHLLIHKDYSEVQVYYCDLCKYKTKFKNVLMKHMIIHKDPADVIMYKCDICEFQTRYKNSLKGHSLLHKNSSEVPLYHCNSCEYKTKRKTNFKNHLVLHKDPSEIQMYQCNKCEFKSKRKMGLKSHMLVHKDSSEVQVYKCDRCDFKTKYKQHLKVHSLVHKDSSNTQMFQCDECEYKTKYKHSLKKHIKTHRDPADVSLYWCETCKYKTNNKSNLANHMLTHKDLSDVQIYKCANCEFQTKHKRSIQSHVLTHLDRSKMQRFQCKECDFKTMYQNNLKKHSLSHKDISDTSLKIYQCYNCEFKSKYRNSIRQHVRTHMKNRKDRSVDKHSSTEQKGTQMS